MNPTPQTLIEDLPISQTCKNVFANTTLKTVADVRRQSDAQLLRHRNLGRKRLAEIRAATRQFDAVPISLRELPYEMIARLEAYIARSQSKATSSIKRLERDIEAQVDRVTDLVTSFDTFYGKALHSHLILDGTKQLMECLDRCQAEEKDMRQRALRLGEKGSHAERIRSTLLETIRAKNWGASKELCSQLIALYETNDAPKKTAVY